MKYLKKIACLGVLLWSVQAAFADNAPKFAYIDTMRIYTDSNSAQQINRQLESEFAERRAALERHENEILSFNQKIAAESKSSTKAKLAKQREKLQKQYIPILQQFEVDYSLRRNEEFSHLQRQAYQAIMQIRREKGLDIVLDNAVWVDKKYDITDQVIEILNKNTQP